MIPNSEYRTGVQVPPRDTVDVKKQKAETIRVAQWMIMHNEPVSNQQHLENSIDSGLINRAEASVILADRPFLGQLYLDRNIAATCSDIRKASQHPAAKNTLWLVTVCECCRACAKDRFCVESGKQLLGSAPVGKVN